MKASNSVGSATPLTPCCRQSISYLNAESLYAPNATRWASGSPYLASRMILPAHCEEWRTGILEGFDVAENSGDGVGECGEVRCADIEVKSMHSRTNLSVTLDKKQKVRHCFDLRTVGQLAGEESRKIKVLGDRLSADCLVPRRAIGLGSVTLRIVVEVLIFLNFFSAVFGRAVLLFVLVVY